MDDRLCISNMAIECGAKNGIFPVDDITLEYVKGRSERPYEVYEADEDAEYDSVVTIDLSTLAPTVACPHLPENTKTVDELSDVKIDQVVIGSCTNGRIEDMRAAASIIKGKKIADGVRCIVIPATQSVYLQCIKEGIAEAFVEAGAIVSTPTCGPCLGSIWVFWLQVRLLFQLQTVTLSAEYHVDSKIYLASPAVAAASAIKGYIADPREI